ncbi:MULTISPECIES: hypothetical protein [Roseobacteraceae]|uniref:hypothetical protein n=1 Tax=Roseobacteraceae TaxID=2854170 RepID=UPI00080AB5F1|nr:MULTISPECIES: hypothetical protein [Roseobacteraceae]ANT58935.1 hypothetical protein AYJ57_00295 [Salipiger sp. CCB-MM3]MCA0994654.1 hypothetical protein [Alloyangia pacifica]NDV99384.1 hypothetical protein [Salipiger sp. PrR002]NDW55870.1 hypothetical protein [Salipiger sp. PrR004]
MILCSCTCLDQRAVQAVVREMLHEDPWTVITPGRVFHRAGRRMECGRCCRLVNTEAQRFRHKLGYGSDETTETKTAIREGTL